MNWGQATQTELVAGGRETFAPLSHSRGRMTSYTGVPTAVRSMAMQSHAVIQTWICIFYLNVSILKNVQCPESSKIHKVKPDSQVALVVNNLPVNVGDVTDVGSIPGSGKSPWGGHGNPPQYSCLENPMDGEAWWATVHRVAENQTQLKWLSTY